ncbi:MAG: hypothetical protein CVU92_03515 [Firmicutes bacterium HGW-Firmicutes-17]|jgi:hypothetical protein|nr:MAG: hypothetical protein CVU92_03515 [Firmicutes bacterium HGW-Firmicutes-17]
MAIGDVIPKKIFQGAISATATAKYTVPTGYRTQVVEIWADNQNTTTSRKLAIFAHGLASTNQLAHNIEIAADQSKIISDNKIILATGETLGFKQDAGADVNVTVYGYEEQVN